MKKFKFNKKDIIATDCKIVSEDENGIYFEMKINNNEFQKLSDLSIFEKVSNNDADNDADWLYFLAMVSLAIIGIVILLLI